MAVISTSKYAQPIASHKSGGTVYQNTKTKQTYVAPAQSRGSVLSAQTTRGGAPSPISGGQQPIGEAPMESAPDQGGIDFDAIINPVLETLGQTEAEAQSLFSQQQGDIEAGKQTSARRLASTQQSQRSLLESGATRQKQEGETAADEARRQFAEVQQGIQGLYGGTTGTGAFAAELAGRDALGRIANIRQTVSGALKEIDEKKVQLEELGRIALEDIDNEARSQLSRAREGLNATLSQVRSQRGELASRKAEMAMNAMQNFRDLKAQIDARNTAFKQQLYLNQQAAAQKLASAENRARGIAESFKVYNMQGPEGAVTPVRVGSQGTVLDFSGNQVQAPGALYGVGGTVPMEETNEDDMIERLINSRG